MGVHPLLDADSAMTGAQFIGAHCPWHWSGWVLAASIDVAFVMSLQADATLARYGSVGGHWPTAFRWLTGAFSVFVNIGDAALTGDLIGIPVHLIAPALLLVLGEAGPAWRRQLVTLDVLTAHHTVAAAIPETRASTTEGVRAPRRTRAASGRSPSEVRTLTTETRTNTPPPGNAAEARARIIDGRLHGLSQRETARRAHRSVAYVRKIWSVMEHNNVPTDDAG